MGLVQKVRASTSANTLHGDPQGMQLPPLVAYNGKRGKVYRRCARSRGRTRVGTSEVLFSTGDLHRDWK